MTFHYLTRGIIQSQDKFLLVREIGSLNTFLPGGHIEVGEKAEFALVRELKEELGLTCNVSGFVGAIEHSWPEHSHSNFEINLLFRLTAPYLSSNIPPVSKEGHLEFVWASVDELENLNLQPFPLRNCLSSLTTNSTAFWASTLQCSI